MNQETVRISSRKINLLWLVNEIDSKRKGYSVDELREILRKNWKIFATRSYIRIIRNRLRKGEIEFVYAAVNERVTRKIRGEFPTIDDHILEALQHAPMTSHEVYERLAKMFQANRGSVVNRLAVMRMRGQVEVCEQRENRNVYKIVLK